jgi:hypothetical protein
VVKESYTRFFRRKKMKKHNQIYFNPAKPISIILAVAVSAVFLAGQGIAAFPDYNDQNTISTNIHSGICTSDGPVVWDSGFAQIVSNALAPHNFAETAFAFMECYGGGMIDELIPVVGGSADVTSFTSASRHDETSWWGTFDPNSGGNAESYYNLYYSQRAGGATVYRHDEAGKYGYDNDRVGPVIKNQLLEHPQYKFTYWLMNKVDVTLHRANLGGSEPNKFLAVVFGGSTNDWSNYNSVARIYSDLKARGYTDAEIYLMYPANTKPNGTALPAGWVRDSGTTYQDMLNAWTWVKNNTTATTQVYYWNSICHGTQLYAPPPPSGGYQSGEDCYFDLTADFIDQVTKIFSFFDGRPDAISGIPYFQVITSVPVPDLMILLNHKPLLFRSVALLPDTMHYLHKYTLDQIDVDGLRITGNTITFIYSAGGIDYSMAGITTGDMPNAVSECVVNFEDYAAFASQWLQSGCSPANNWCSGADLDQLGDVNEVDLGLFTGYWLDSCPYNWLLK